MHCHHLGNCWYLPKTYETISNSPVMMPIMIPLADFFFILMGDMMLSKAHGLNVSFWEGYSHIFCSTCSNGNMGGVMATIAKYLFLLEVGQMCDGMPYDDALLSITCGMFWANWFYSVGGRIFTDLIFMLPLEGNIISAQD